MEVLHNLLGLLLKQSPESTNLARRSIAAKHSLLFIIFLLQLSPVLISSLIMFD